MKITFNNYIGKNCDSFYYIFENDFLIGSTILTNQLSSITLFDSNKDDNEYPIYIELADADTIDKAMNFYRKYGPIIAHRLVSHNDSEYRSFDTLNCFDKDKEIHENIHDCISYYHFRFYQTQTKCLVEIHRLLTLICNDIALDDILTSLLLECIKLIKNPYFDAMFALEYTDPLDYRKYSEYLSSYPIMKYIFLLNCDHLDQKIVYPNPFIEKFIPTIHLEYENPTFTHSFLMDNKNQIIELAKYIFCNVLSFEIRGIYPDILFKNLEITCDWHFPTLVNAIYFYFYLEHSSSKIITRCANDKCKKLFVHSGAYKNRKYCCSACGHRVTNRKYMQGKRQNPTQK